MTAPPASALDLEHMRQQFDAMLYLCILPEQISKKGYNDLFTQMMTMPHDLRDRQVIDIKDKLVLEVGCGLGYPAWTLAIAIPGTKITRTLFSKKLVKLAQNHLEFHMFDSAEFQVEAMETLSELDYFQTHC